MGREGGEDVVGEFGEGEGERQGGGAEGLAAEGGEVRGCGIYYGGVE